LKMNAGRFFLSSGQALFLLCLSANVMWCSCHLPPAGTTARVSAQKVRTDSSTQKCKQLFHIKQKAEFLATDPLLNCYLALADGRILRYDSAGLLTAEFGNFNFGAAACIDLSRPLRPLIFYRDFAQVIALDTRLTELASLDLRDAGLAQCTALARARDRGLWAYEANQGILYKLDEQGKILLQSDPLDLQLDLSRLYFTQIRVSNHYLLLWAPGEGVALFDAFGQFLKFVKLENVRAIQTLDDDHFLLSGAEELLFYEVEEGVFQTLLLPCGPFEMLQAEIQENRFYLLQEEKIIVLLLSNM